MRVRDLHPRSQMLRLGTFRKETLEGGIPDGLRLRLSFRVARDTSATETIYRLNTPTRLIAGAQGRFDIEPVIQQLGFVRP